MFMPKRDATAKARRAFFSGVVVGLLLAGAALIGSAVYVASGGM
jgi:hypothetical protein